MEDLRHKVVEYLKHQDLPTSSTEFSAGFLDDEGKVFLPQERSYWDYKDKVPPIIKSNEYFGGIVRLVCAFHNTYGGLIIFGIGDVDRRPGHSTLKLDIEKFNSLLRTVLSTGVECVHQKYRLDSYSDDDGNFEVLLVPKRKLGIPPVRPTKSLEGCPAGQIYMRQGHEVLNTKPDVHVDSSHYLSFLYSSRDDYGLGDQEVTKEQEINDALPARPGALPRFLGRIEAMDKLFAWIFADDEPRMFLYGDGGSGKTAIAYEFSKLIAAQAAGIKTGTDHTIDNVIFLSAKNLKLNPETASEERDTVTDFTNAREQATQILLMSGWLTDTEEPDKYTEKELWGEVTELFDTLTILLVIDDIDTLSHGGLDPGMDPLYRILSRSKMGGRVLYTLRNRPSQSPRNSIKVEGLKLETEYPEFIKACCDEFHVSPPK